MLHVIYRSYAGQNQKKRPSYYNKRLALVSFLRARAALDGPCEVIYLNDGPIAEDCLTLMRQSLVYQSGEIIAREKLRLAGSLSLALDLPKQRNWDANDLVWLAEDDYLYLPDAFNGLLYAAKRFTEADYFGLYASIGHRSPTGRPQPDYAVVPAGWHDSEPVLVQGHPWRRALSTTSTFGARVGALREDRLMMELAIRSGGAFDHTSCLMYQGYPPFAWRSLFQTAGAPETSLKQRARKAAIRGGLNLWQIARSQFGAPARILVAPEPALSTHLETAELAAGTDWAEFAQDCIDWGAANGLLNSVMSDPVTG